MAADNPTDARNIKAAETLEKLADEMKNANETIIDAYTSLCTHRQILLKRSVRS
jgi:flagellar hook-associated protein FlgK